MLSLCFYKCSSIKNIPQHKSLLVNEGQTKIDFVINEKDQKIHYSLRKGRKFDTNQLKLMKSKEYVRKITF